jgi:glycosyltransferase involved in cell wall biosynthesis
MALGRPVVLPAVGGAPEMVRPGREGVHIPVGDTPPQVGCLAAQREPRERRRMGERSRATVETRFSESAMVDRYEALLQQLVLRRSERANLRRSATAHPG